MKRSLVSIKPIFHQGREILKQEGRKYPQLLSYWVPWRESWGSIQCNSTQLQRNKQGQRGWCCIAGSGPVCWYSKQWCFLSTLQERVVSWANPQLFYDYNRMEDSGPTMSWWWTRSWPGSPETWVFDFHLPEDIHANKYIWLLHISGIALQDHTLTCMQLLKGKKFTLQIFLAIQLGNCLVGIQFVCIT